MLLEDLGCHSAMMFVDPNGELFNLGSAEGVNFLSSNPDVIVKFRQHFRESLIKDNVKFPFKLSSSDRCLFLFDSETFLPSLFFTVSLQEVDNFFDFASQHVGC